MTKSISPATNPIKQHFAVLDGLRGIAALCVVLFHFMEWIYPDPSNNFIGHGFLAVDFFFCLSGFVIGYSYDDRMEQIGVISFLKSRLIRLHPLVIAGSVLGLLAFLFDPFGNTSATYTAGKVFLISISSLLLVPYPAMADRGYNLFGLNAPSWSLFWEYIASIVYAIALRKLNRTYLIILTITSAVMLSMVCYKASNLLGGWSGPTFWDGGARVSYSFLAGLLIYRSNWIIKNNLGFTGIGIMLSAAFIIPYSKLNWIAEPLIVIIYFPLLIALGAGINLKPGVKSICTYLGLLSYPLYMTHYSALWIFGNFYTNQQPTATTLILVIAGAIILLIGIAHLVMTQFDIPVRKYLKNITK